MLPSIDAVVLTHPDLEHLGALPYLIARYGLKARIFATGPIRRMGQLAMQELLLNKRVSQSRLFCIYCPYLFAVVNILLSLRAQKKAAALSEQ